MYKYNLLKVCSLKLCFAEINGKKESSIGHQNRSRPHVLIHLNKAVATPTCRAHLVTKFGLEGLGMGMQMRLGLGIE